MLDNCHIESLKPESETKKRAQPNPSREEKPVITRRLPRLPYGLQSLAMTEVVKTVIARSPIGIRDRLNLRGRGTKNCHCEEPVRATWQSLIKADRRLETGDGQEMRARV